MTDQKDLPGLKICTTSEEEDEEDEPSNRNRTVQKQSSGDSGFSQIPTLQSLQNNIRPTTTNRTAPYYQPVGSDWDTCHICGDKFTKYDDLYSHMYTHDPVKPTIASTKLLFSSDKIAPPNVSLCKNVQSHYFNANPQNFSNSNRNLPTFNSSSIKQKPLQRISKKQQCEFCKRSFVDLKRHQIKCKQKIDVTLNLPTLTPMISTPVKKRKLIDTTNKQLRGYFVCSQCDHSFETTKDLKSHKLVCKNRDIRSSLRIRQQHQQHQRPQSQPLPVSIDSDNRLKNSDKNKLNETIEKLYSGKTNDLIVEPEKDQNSADTKPVTSPNLQETIAQFLALNSSNDSEKENLRIEKDALLSKVKEMELKQKELENSLAEKEKADQMKQAELEKTTTEIIEYKMNPIPKNYTIINRTDKNPPESLKIVMMSNRPKTPNWNQIIEFTQQEKPKKSIIKAETLNECSNYS